MTIFSGNGAMQSSCAPAAGKFVHRGTGTVFTVLVSRTGPGPPLEAALLRRLLGRLLRVAVRHLRLHCRVILQHEGRKTSASRDLRPRGHACAHSTRLCCWDHDPHRRESLRGVCWLQVSVLFAPRRGRCRRRCRRRRRCRSPAARRSGRSPRRRTTRRRRTAPPGRRPRLRPATPGARLQSAMCQSIITSDRAGPEIGIRTSADLSHI